MKAVFCGLLVVVCSMMTQQEVFGQEKEFKIKCEATNAETGVHLWRNYRIHLSLRYFENISTKRDFSLGVRVTVVIVNRRSNAPLTIKNGVVSWRDFVTIVVKRIVTKKYEREEGTMPVHPDIIEFGEEIGGFVEPKSTYRVSLFTAFEKEGKEVLQKFGDTDSVCFLVQFDNPELLEEGYYAFLPEVDFDAMSMALPDLTEENLEEPLEFEKEWYSCWAEYIHKKTDLTTVRGRKRAMALYLFEAGDLYGLGKKEEAFVYLDKIFTINPDSVPPLIFLAGIHYKEDKGEEGIKRALSYLHKAESILEERKDMYLEEKECILILQEVCKWIGQFYHRLEQYEDVESYYLRSIELLKHEAFTPGPDIDDALGAERTELFTLLDMARKEKPLKP